MSCEQWVTTKFVISKKIHIHMTSQAFSSRFEYHEVLKSCQWPIQDIPDGSRLISGNKNLLFGQFPPPQNFMEIKYWVMGCAPRTQNSPITIMLKSGQAFTSEIFKSIHKTNIIGLFTI